MKRVSLEDVLVADPVYEDLEKVLVRQGIRAAALWDQQSIIDGYQFHEVTIDGSRADQWFDRFGNELQMVASRAARRFVLETIAAELKQMSQEEINAKF